jgi:hypothetical protein
LVDLDGSVVAMAVVGAVGVVSALAGDGAGSVVETPVVSDGEAAGAGRLPSVGKSLIARVD